MLQTLRQRFLRPSVSGRLVAVFLILATLMVAVTSGAFLWAGGAAYRQRVLPGELALVASLVSQRPLTEAILQDPMRANLLFLALQEHIPGLVGGDVRKVSGDIVYSFSSPQQDGGAHLDILESRYPLRIGHDPAGELRILVVPRLPEIYLQGALIVSMLIALLFMLLIRLFLSHIQRTLVEPINSLIHTARMISTEKDYSIRAAKAADDELGTLSDAFNNMIRRVEARERLLNSAREKAESATEAAQYLAEETRRANAKLESEIRERTQAERALTDFKNYLVNIINSMPSVLITVDGNLTVTQWNREATRVSGTATGDAMYSRIDQVFPALAGFREYMEEALHERNTHKIESLPQRIGSEQRYYDIVIYPLSDTGYPGAAVRMDDVTDRLQLEEMLVQTEKMMSVGGLAAGMAHEINNPLGAILHSAQNIRRRLSPELPRNTELAYRCGTNLNIIRDYLDQQNILRFLENIQDAGERAAKIVSNMLQFSRHSDKTLSPNNLGDLLERSIEIARSDLDLQSELAVGNIDLETDLDPGLIVPCMPSEIEQVMLNLIKNGIHAIRARGDDAPPGKLSIRSSRNGPYAVIQVEDNGIGMSDEVRKRIFEPFFTTKDVGSGTGLGLSVSYFIICTNHRGQMEAQSEPGRGTCFTIRLPVQQDPRLSGSHQGNTRKS